MPAHKSFDPNAFRSTHRVDLHDPICGQLRLVDKSPRHRVTITGPSGTVVYDSQKVLGDAGVFDQADAHDHGQGWLEAQIRQAELIESLTDQRRYQLADVDALSHQQQADLVRQRTALTGEIKKHDRLRKRLADEARAPDVRVEYRGSNRWDVFAAPSVFDGQLDADGNMVTKPAPVGGAVAKAAPKPKRSRKKGSTSAEQPPIIERTEPCETAVPFEHDEPIATATKHTDGSISVELHSGTIEGSDGFLSRTFNAGVQANNYANGQCPAATLVRRLESHELDLLPETMVMIAIGEWSVQGKHERRPILAEWLETRLEGLGPLDLGDRSELWKRFDEALVARTGEAADAGPAIAAARLVTDQDPQRLAVSTILEYVRQIEDTAILAWVREIEEKRPETHGKRSKPRPKVLDEIDRQMAGLASASAPITAPGVPNASPDEVFE